MLRTSPEKLMRDEGLRTKLTRHVQQQVEELVNIVRESEAKTEQDVGQALKVLRSNLSLQMTEASGRHLQKLEEEAVGRIQQGRSTERFTDALDPMRATLADLSSRFEEVESKAMLGQPGEGQMSPSRLKQQILAHVEGRLRKFESESLDKIANHRERSPPRECDVEMKLKLQQIERKLAGEVKKKMQLKRNAGWVYRYEVLDELVARRPATLPPCCAVLCYELCDGESIVLVSDSHDELKKSLETDFRSAVDNVSQKVKADSRGLSDQVGRIQRELNSLTTQRAELDKTVAEFKEKVNVMSANSSKFITEQITELELDCHVKSVQSSTEEEDRSQIEFVKAEIDSKSAETADRLRRMMGSLIELNMRVEKQRGHDDDPKEVWMPDRLEHREMISQLYKKMSDVVSAMHYPK
ncbi:hypothetical protein FOZ60_000301, partial [Perkinsus olseni]